MVNKMRCYITTLPSVVSSSVPLSQLSCSCTSTMPNTTASVDVVPVPVAVVVVFVADGIVDDGDVY